MAVNYALYLGNQSLIDPMGSVIINTSATGNPVYQWVNTSTLNGFGVPTGLLGQYLPHKDTISYRIKNLEFIPEASNPAAYIGDATCLTSPSTCTKRGPFLIQGRKYYIDFMYIYFVNTGTDVLYSPVFSLDSSKCDENYGYFIGVPKTSPGATATSTGGPIEDLLASDPAYTNDLGSLGLTDVYKFTTLDNTSSNISVNLDIANIISLVDNTITYGQAPIVAEDGTGTAITLNTDTGVNDHYMPAILMRYISENAITKPIDITLRYGPNL